MQDYVIIQLKDEPRLFLKEDGFHTNDVSEAAKLFVNDYPSMDHLKAEAARLLQEADTSNEAYIAEQLADGWSLSNFQPITLTMYKGPMKLYRVSYTQI
jgi:hypothetical protein